MKHADLLFQLVLLAVTAVFVIAVLLTMKSDALFLVIATLVGWTIALFICQIVHSFTIVLAFGNKKGIRLAMRVYWFASGVYLLFFLLRNVFPDSQFKIWLLFPILPALIAIYFWSVTVYFWARQLLNGSAGQQRNGVMDRLLRFINRTP